MLSIRRNFIQTLRSSTSILIPQNSFSTQSYNSILSPEDVTFYKTNGYLHIPNALSTSLCDKLRDHINKTYIYNPKAINNQHRSMFTTKDQTRKMNDQYFLDSGDKIRYFYEEHAFHQDGQTLCVPVEKAINKIGHNLHNLDPIFQEISYSNMIKNILRTLNYERPIAVQSMYIFKQPKIGGEVMPHQDGTYLFTEPQSVMGFWFALEDCTHENGCLYGVPGSHLTVPIRQKMQRTSESQFKVTGKLMEHVPETIEPLSIEGSQPILTKKGDLVLLHGAFVHYSEANLSPVSRHAYALHVVESGKGVVYPKENWLQMTGNKPFVALYE